MTDVAIQKVEPQFSGAVEQALIKGDLKDLSTDERLAYYNSLCNSIGINPLSRPFEYITLNGRLTLYTTKNATDQLRNIHNVSITITAREEHGGCWLVTALAKLPNGRTDESIGAVNIANLKGDPLANALMKAETKAKRRVTLSICGLGMLDETELETIPSATPATNTTHQDLHHADKTEGYAGEPGERDPNEKTKAWAAERAAATAGRPKAPNTPTGNAVQQFLDDGPKNPAEQVENLAKLKSIIVERKVTAETQAKWCEMFGGVASIDQLSDENILKIIKKYESLKTKAA